MALTQDLAFQINLAVAAHGMWKARLLKAIETGASDFAADKVEKDDLCDFGKWLYGADTRSLQHTPSYAKVRDLHAAFHREAAKVLAMALSGRRKDAEKAMQGAYQQGSIDLVRALQAWKQA